MKLTKYEHACFTLEKNGEVLIVDPGNLSGDFVAPAGAVGVVITHEHKDHLDNEQLAAIVDKNPDVVIVAHQTITDTMEIFQTQPVVSGDSITLGSFLLEFFGGQHATISPEIPPIPNLGVMINDLVYYPGDSFSLPEKPVDILALPVSAPWMKLSESMEFLKAVKPRLAFPTHDAILSEKGQSMVDRMLSATAASVGTIYQRINENPLEV